ncbi:MAG: helix-turn-helix domain-containing protein [Gemmatimonadales bacterium]
MPEFMGLIDGTRASAPNLEPALREWLRGMPVVEASYHRARRRLIEVFEREYIQWLMSRAGERLSRAARVAGVDRTTLYRMMERRGLRRASPAEAEASAL